MQRARPSGPQATAGVHALVVIVARALDHEAVGRGLQQGVKGHLGQRATVVRPAVPPHAQVDHPRSRPRYPRDEIDRLQDAHRVAQVGQPARGPVGEVDKDQVGLGGDPRRAGMTASGGNVHDVRAVRARRPRICVGGLVGQRLIGRAGAQSGVDLALPVDDAIAVGLGSGRRRQAALVPEGQQPRRAVPLAQVGMRKVAAPVHHADDHPCPGQARPGGAAGIRIERQAGQARAACRRRFGLGAKEARRFEAGYVLCLMHAQDGLGWQAAGGDPAKARDDAHARRHAARPVEPDDRLHLVDSVFAFAVDQFPECRVHLASLCRTPSWKPC